MQTKSNFLKVFTNNLKQPVLPKWSFLKNFDIDSIELFLEWISDFLSPEDERKTVVTSHSLMWLYAFLAKLKLPVLEDISSHLAKILTAVYKSSAAPFLNETELASHKAIMVIIVNYFLSHKFFA
jgi:hypothetical protein